MDKRMKIIPEHKLDFDACKNLQLASDEQIINDLPALLEWLQDINWPVARYVRDRIQNLGSPLIEPTRTILNGSDDVWKYSIACHLLPCTSKEVINALKPELLRLANNPTKSEELEEVNLAVQELLENVLKITKAELDASTPA